MIEKVQDYVRANREQVLRITFAATFISRGIMQVFPWLFIHGITRNFVIHPPGRELAICALGLLLLFIRWKPTMFRISIVWICAATLMGLIISFAHIFWKDHVYFTTPFWIFSVTAFCTWAYGNTLIIVIAYHRLMASLEREKGKVYYQ
ncbi:MAG: hypothetical protein JSV88_26460 [Candidatus Aminicenantes bacterium]|nr:MAG: hypothetical protein JSV88_26460 [Candidatus Aminicenantes bacterium]